MSTSKKEFENLLVLEALFDMIVCDSTLSEDEERLQRLEDEIKIIRKKRYMYRGKVPKSKDWIKNIVPELTDFEFKQFFRVNRDSFAYILALIEDDDVFKIKEEEQTPLKLQLLITLYRLGSSGESAALHKIASRFGVGEGTVSKVFERVMEAIINIRKYFLNWPSEEERREIVERTKEELSGCIGYLDGVEFFLKDAPIKDHVSYVSRKMRYSIKANMICDDRGMIRHVRAGYPGCVHDARIYKECDLFKNPTAYFSDDQWVGADAAYMLTKTVITAYRSNSTAMTAKERADFNNHFSQYRVRIEHVFGRLKQKFCSLQELPIRLGTDKSHKLAGRWILTCCILHNILQELEIEDDCSMANFEENNDNPLFHPDFDHNDANAEQKRQAIYRNIVQNREI